MKDYLKMHANQAAYETWLGSSNFITPNVSAITGSSSVLYNPKIATPSVYNFLDILWSDGTATQTVRPTTDGVTPIGLCVIPTGFLGTNEKARFMSLKFVGGSSDGATVGDATGTTMWLGNNTFLQWTLQSAMTDVAGLTNYNQLVSDSNNQNSFGYSAQYEEEDPSKIHIYTSNDTWIGLEPNNTFTSYAMGDINGAQNTSTVANLGSLSNYPAFASVLNYYTPGTQAGDWYLPALGELVFLHVDQFRITPVLRDISSQYSSDCMTALFVNDTYWSSTEYNSSYALQIELSSGTIGRKDKYKKCSVIAMLQK